MVFHLFSGGSGDDSESKQLLPANDDKKKYYSTTDPLATTRDPDHVTQETPIARFEDSFYDDCVNLREGSIPQSLAVAMCNAVACGVGAFLYNWVLQFLLEFCWHTIPQRFVVGVWPEWAYALYIPLLGLIMSLGLGLSVVALGEPGDLAYTIDCVHKHAFVHLNHVTPMCVASLFSIVGGGSVGPEAPLVAICAALGGNISFYGFKSTNKNVMRKHTLMGMSAALAAFFGAPLGGSLFALEVCSRFGIEYFEHTMECILCGLCSMMVFRGLTGVNPGPVWSFETEPLKEAEIGLIVVCGGIGLLGTGVAYLFVNIHWHVISGFQSLGLLSDTKKAVYRALLGGVVIYGVGMCLPQTLFWGEAEFQTLWNLEKASTLEHVFPTSGLLGFEMDTFGKCLLVGLAKLVTISFSVAGGFRGGFIFPFFAAGAAFGRALLFVFPTSLPPTVTCLAFAAGINVAVTKTAMATTLILCYLSGEQNALPPVLCASVVSLLASGYMPFIKTQISREDEQVELIRSNQRRAKAKATFKSATRRLIIAQRLWHHKDDEEEEHDVPLSETKPSLRRHAQRGYLV